MAKAEEKERKDGAMSVARAQSVQANTEEALSSNEEEIRKLQVRSTAQH